MNKKNILITGGAGFIGSNFVKNICIREKEKYNFHILDSLTYAGKFKNIENLIDGNSITFVKEDIRNSEKIKNIFYKKNFDGVIHFAAESHVDNSISSPNIFVETNVLGTLNLLNAALSLKNPHFNFLHVSTDEVYGSLKESDLPFTESHPLKPNSPYSASKASSDLLVIAFQKTYGLNTKITRCSNNYGPLQNNEKLIPLMIKNALSNSPLPVYGTGKNIRDWIHVNDHNEGVWKVFQKGNPGSIYNLGGNSERRNIDIVKIILELTGRKQNLIHFVEDRKGHDWRYAINYSKAQKDLGWTPKIKFEEGIQKTVQWYIKNNTEHSSPLRETHP